MSAYAQSGHCRWKRILEHFGEADSFDACGSCDNCERIARAEAEARTEAAAVAPAELREGSGPIGNATPEPAFLPGDAVTVPRYGSGVIDRVDATGVSVRFGDEAQRTFVESAVKRTDAAAGG